MMENIDVRMSYRNGFNLTIDVDAPDRWHYIAVGIKPGLLEIKHGSASPDEVSESFAAMAQGEGEPAEKYAAGHLSYIDTLLSVPLGENND